MIWGGTNGRIFIKTAKKDAAFTCTLTELFDPESALHKVIKERHLNDFFIVSEIMEQAKDEYGRKEYRCIIFDGKLNSISRYTDDLLHRIEPEVVEAAERIISQMAKVRGWPTYYVIDLLEYITADGEREIDVVEFNPITAAGTFLYNSMDVHNKPDLLHDDIYRSIGPENRRNGHAIIKQEGLPYKNFKEQLEDLARTR